MTPNFVPVIGSSFDNVGNQQLAWAGFNQRQSEDNLRRAQEADMAGNRWFENLAQMQQRDQERQTQAETLAQQTAAQAAVENRRLSMTEKDQAERAREFGIDTALKQKQLDYPERLQKIQDEKQADYLDDLGKSMDPHVTEVGRAYEQAQKAIREADTQKQAAIAKELKNLPPGTMYNKGQFVKTLLGKPTSWATKEESDAAITAASNVADAQAAYDNAVRDSRDTMAAWLQIHSDLSKQGLPPIKVGDEWHIHSPLLRKTFGEKVADAGKKPEKEQMDPTQASSMAMDVLNRAAGDGAWAGFGAGQAATNTGTTPTPGISIQKVLPGTPGANFKFDPNSRGVTPASTATPMSAPATPPAATPPVRGDGRPPFIPQSMPPGDGQTIKSIPPTNATWTPNGFIDQSGRPFEDATIKWDQPLSYQSPDDVLALYYNGRLSKTNAMLAIKANFPNLPPGRTLQLSMGPEWQVPSAKNASPGWMQTIRNSAGVNAVFGPSQSPYE